jgi:hypothetical protein
MPSIRWLSFTELILSNIDCSCGSLDDPPVKKPDEGSPQEGRRRCEEEKRRGLFICIGHGHLVSRFY